MGLILVADDDRNCRDSITKTLERAGHVVEGVEDVDSALRALDLHTFDLVVSDYRMPRKTGLDFLAELRRRGSEVPFLLITAVAGAAAEDAAREMGTTELLKKPFRKQQLLDWVKRLVSVGETQNAPQQYSGTR